MTPRFWLVVTLSFGAAPLTGQQDLQPVDSLLAEVTRLAAEGQGDSARATVRARLAQVQPGDPAYPGVLFAAGVVALDADSALTYFRRVSIEHAQSSWAAPALLRQAQFAYATRDFSTALATVQRILADHPFAAERAAAAFWAGRAELELNDLTAACGFMQQAEAEAGTNVETANQARFYLQRCRAATFTPADTAAQPTTTPTYSVQVAAVRSAAAVDDLMRRLRQYGYTPRVVRDPDGLLKVRVGQYRARSEAVRIAGQLKVRLGGSPFVVEER